MVRDKRDNVSSGNGEGNSGKKEKLGRFYNLREFYPLWRFNM